MFSSARSWTASAFFHFAFGLLVFFSLFEQLTSKPSVQNIEIHESRQQKMADLKNKPLPVQQVIPSEMQDADHSQSAVSVDDDSNVKNHYIQELMTFLNRHKVYPRLAKLKRQEGVVTVEFSITPQGTISGVRIVQHSDFQELNQATMDMVQSIGNVPVPPLAMHVQLPIVYRLNELSIK